ncbi:MAG: winged helix DNA-binding protein [Polymorphobacter sp.]
MPDRPVDAALVRRLLRVRRDRDRYFPADIFADPAWDMLLDLIAAQLEGRQLPVSSLCIAADVPTTTALRWVRSLTEAGIFERSVDPADARRSHVRLSDTAATAMLAWLRAFSAQFVPR